MAAHFFMGEVNAGFIKAFLKAKDPKKLMDLMLENNVKKRAYHKYDVVYADGFWFAWYEVDINNFLSEKVKDVISKG